MNVLDIDLDFFLDGREFGRPVHEKNRLSENEFAPWPDIQVEKFLLSNLSLRADSKYEGKIVIEHDEVFDYWKELVETERLAIPFHLVHVDAHADMGMGDGSFILIYEYLLHHDVENRSAPRRDDTKGLAPGNFIAFALACRWLSSIDYVLHPDTRRMTEGLSDIPCHMFKDFDPQSGIIQLKKYAQGAHREATCGLKSVQPIDYEPEVPIRILDYESYNTSDDFSLVTIAQSPSFTPRTSDQLLAFLASFFRFSLPPGVGENSSSH